MGVVGARSRTVSGFRLPVSVSAAPSIIYDIILAVGTSELVGTNVRDGQDISWPGVSQWRSRAPLGISTTITPLDQGIAPDGTSYLSLLEYMAKAMYARRGNPVLIDTGAYNGQTLVYSGPTLAVGGSVHEAAITKFNGGFAGALAVYPGSTVQAIVLWDNGAANDAQHISGSTAMSNFTTASNAVVNSIRTRVSGCSTATPVIFAPCIPEQIASYNSSANTGPQDLTDAIIAQCVAGSNLKFVTIDAGNTTDNLHQTNAGWRILGARADAILADTTAPAISTTSTFSVYTAQPINIKLAADKFVTWSTATSGWEIVRTFGSGGTGNINSTIATYTLRLTGNANASYASPPANPTVVARDGAGNTSSKTITVNVLPAYGSTTGTGTVTEAHSFASQFNGGNAPFPYTVPSVTFGAGLNLFWLTMNGSTTGLTGVTVNGVAATLVSSQGLNDISKLWSIPLAMAGTFDVVLTGTGSVAAVTLSVVTLTNSLASPTGTPFVLDNGYHSTTTFGSGSIACPSGGKIVGQGYIGSGAATPDTGVTATYNDTGGTTGVVDAYRTTTGALTFTGNQGYASIHVTTWGPA